MAAWSVLAAPALTFTALARPLGSVAPAVACGPNFFGSRPALSAPRSRCTPPVLQATPPPTPTPDEQQAKLTKLLVSILIDLIGIATYAVPAIGEVGDFAWAPISAYLVYQLYGNGLIAGIAFAEELLPGLDIVPTATIAWVLENTQMGQNINEKAPPASGGSSGSAPSWPPAGMGDSMKRADASVVDEDKT